MYTFSFLLKKKYILILNNFFFNCVGNDLKSYKRKKTEKSFTTDTSIILNILAVLNLFSVIALTL